MKFIACRSNAFCNRLVWNELSQGVIVVAFKNAFDCADKTNYLIGAEEHLQHNFAT